jgi:Ribbon-helix-helix domain
VPKPPRPLHPLRPKLQPRTVLMPIQLAKWFGAYSQETGISLSELLRRALDEYKQRHESKHFSD